jgi:hypothetical protein
MVGEMLPPKPTGTVFGVRADGKLMTPGYPSSSAAEQAAKGLFQQGYKTVEIVDRVSGDVVKQLTPP